MKTGASTYYGLLAMLRQSELLDEAARLRRSREPITPRRGHILNLSLRRRRRP